MSHGIGVAYSEAKPFPEMLSTVSDPNLEVFQVTTDPDSDAHAAAMHSSHALFTPDSRRFVFYRRRGTANGPGKVVLTLCELADGYRLRDLTDEESVRAPILSLDGRLLYYFVDNGAAEKPHIVLRRISLDDFRRETLVVVDSPVAGVGRVPRGGHMYDGASLSQDGKRLSTSCSFYTDTDPMFSSLIVDLERMTIRGFQFEKYNWRPFGTFYRGTDPRFVRHLLFCHSHYRSGTDVHGKWYAEKADDIPRCTLHVLTDEGEQVGVIPIGDEGEGVDHACWRGGLYEVVTHTSSFKTAPHWRGIILSAPPVACAAEDQYKGARTPGAQRVELTRHIRRPDLCHHSWDASGTRVVCDTEGWHNNGLSSYLWLGTVKPGSDGLPAVVPKYLIHPQSSWTGSYWTQCQPALSPDCRTVFVNSDFCCKSGHPQLFAIRGFTFPG
jgi:hypothetical protein